jgi:hypothetical protein
LGGIVCHWAWGGKLARQERPGVHVDGGHPADLLAGPEPLLLDGVHLPDVVGRLGPGLGCLRPLGSPRAVDPLPLEGPLQCPRRRDERGAEETEELDADPPGAPGRVPPLELTGPAEDVAAVPRSGPAAGLIADDQAVIPVVAEGPPKVADGGKGEEEVCSDPGQGLAFQVPADDLLASGVRDGAGHEESSGVFEQKNIQRFYPCLELGGITFCPIRGVT